MTDELLSLAAKVEAAEGPDRELDSQIKRLLGHGWDYSVSWDRWDALKGEKVSEPVAKPYTASLDAAMMLVPEGWEWSLEAEETEMFWPVSQPWTYRCQMGHLIEVEAATPALALTAAALCAQANGGKQ